MNQKLSFEQKYNAIGKKESEFEGVFITAVTSTGIFCRPSCRAKKPKAENVIFYRDTQEALQNGFRPCKICRPMEPEDDCPKEIKLLISELQSEPFPRLKDYDLKKRNIEPSYLRRWFKKHHGITFQAYQRMLRINKAYNQIKGGNSVSGSAFGAGYESLSGFSETYKNIFGETPAKSTNKTVINIIRFSTRLGAMFACATDEGLCLLEFTDRRMLEWEFKDLQKRLNAVILPGENKILDQTQKEILEYLDGKRKSFTLPLLSPGTEFQKKAWDLLLKIPYGETRSYLQQGERMNNPSAVRAIAQANGFNKISFIIPCHRVIGNDGDLKGYGGGLGRKKWILEMEKTNSN